jgi:hypothetical protein
MEQIRLSGADRPHGPIPPLRTLDAAWTRRILVASLVCLLAGLAAGVLAATVLPDTGRIGPTGWGLAVAGAALVLSGIIVALRRVDDAPRDLQMDPRHRAAKGLRASVRKGQVPEDPTTRQMQDYMAVEMVQYIWPILLAVPGMVLVLWVIFVPAPVVILALLLVAVWVGVRINGTMTGRRYYRLRGLD